jgi:hypothetical protein
MRWWKELLTFKLDDDLRQQLIGVERIVDGTARAFAETQWPMTVKLQLDGEIKEWTVPAVNAPNFWTSETLDYILKTQSEVPFAVGVFVTGVSPTGEMPISISYSLRSRPDFDVTDVAKAIGGGGHKQAAGASIKNPDIVRQVLEHLSIKAQ